MPETKLAKEARKMVPESDLIAVKERERKVREDLAKLTQHVNQLQSELKVAKMTEVNDEDVLKVREFLLSQETDLNNVRAESDKREESLNERETTISEREKSSRVQALASQYKVEVDAIKNADDPEKEALRIVNERLTKGKTEEESPAENAFENAQPSGVVKKSIADIDVSTPEGHAEFAKVEARLKAEALKKK